jgi:hypothetical protein
MQDSPASLPQSLSAADLVSRAADFAIEAQQPLRTLCSDRPRDYFLKVESIQEIDREDEALISWAKGHNRFLSAIEVSSYLATPGLEDVGNKEHNVWKVETSSGAFMIRRTKGGIYGLPERSPFQYLQRMADVSVQIPDAEINFLGVSQSPLGAGAIWTIQPYIEGGHPSDDELAEWLSNQGWVQMDDRRHRYYQRGPVKIHDLHIGNCIKTPNGHIIPVDVFFEGLE